MAEPGSTAVADAPLIAARGLYAGYGSSVIVRDLDLEVLPGQVVALLGPNGAGKTTTLLTMCGDLPALDGQVLFGGTATTASLARRAQAGLGFVSQERAVLMRLTVAENVRLAGCDHRVVQELFPELVEHYARRVGDLSGGQQQMVALARALARRPSVLLADELSLGLAPMVVDRLLGAVRAAADRGLGVLLVEQHIAKVLSVADHVYVMRNGEIVLSDSGAQLKDRPDAVGQAYFASGEA